MFSAGWGQSNTWNTNAVDTNEQMGIPFGGRIFNQETAGKDNMMPSQQIGNNPLEETKGGNNDARSYPTSSNNPNQDLYRFYNDGAN